MTQIIQPPNKNRYDFGHEFENVTFPPLPRVFFLFIMKENHDKQFEVIGMKQAAPKSSVRPRADEFSTVPDFMKTYAGVLVQPPSRESPLTDPEALRSLEKIKESLAFAYLAANLNLKNLPLKAFMDSFEKKILLTCLRLTGGHQKNAAAVMSIKPTVLFEKMRKHGISRQQMRMAGAWSRPLADKGE